METTSNGRVGGPGMPSRTRSHRRRPTADDDLDEAGPGLEADPNAVGHDAVIAELLNMDPQDVHYGEKAITSYQYGEEEWQRLKPFEQLLSSATPGASRAELREALSRQRNAPVSLHAFDSLCLLLNEEMQMSRRARNAGSLLRPLPAVCRCIDRISAHPLRPGERPIRTR